VYAYIGRGVAYDVKGDHDRAILDYDQAIRLNPKYADAYRDRGLTYFHKGDYDRAIRDHDQAIRLNPKDADTFFGRGWAYDAKGDHDRAIADYDQAIRLDPKYANAFNNRGNAYAAKGDYARAIADYAQAIRLDAKNASAFNNRGAAYFYKGDYDRAIADYDEAIRLDPKFASAFNNRCSAYYKKGDYDQAIADCDEAIRLDPKRVNPYYHRGTSYADKGDFDRAMADYDQAIRLNPKYADALGSRGLAFERRGDAARARADFDAALTERPGDRVATEGLERLAKPAPAPAPQPQQQVAAVAPKPAAPLAEKATTESGCKGQRGAPTLPERGRAQGEETPGVIPEPGTRVALVIGNSNYEEAGFLPNPERDAQAVADTFRKLGFQTVIAQTNLTLRQFRTALDAFQEKVEQGADWAIVYYAGHGAKVAGVKYLFPVDAKRPERETDLKYEAVPLDDLRSAAGMARKLRVMILDSCRDNPLLREMRGTEASRSVNRGFSRLNPDANELVAFSAGEGQIAKDGIGEHSPFTAAFLKHVVEPRVEIGLLFRRVYDEVKATTNKTQQPATYSSLPGDLFYFAIK
jgi:tetratricopeptide (TPR) repeat protein